MSTPEQLAAWKYHQRGWSIFPCKNKIPLKEALKPNKLGRNSTDWLWEYRPTDEEIISWWKEYPTAQIAVACGKLSGIMAIDIDSKTDHKRFPEHVLVPPRELADLYGLQLTTNTGGGGHHLICKYKPDVLGNTVKDIHPQIDIRTEKGYIILPPSIHEGTGIRYSWDKLVDESSEPLELPPLILEQSEASQGTPKDWSMIGKGVGKGSRNNTATQLTGKLLLIFDEDTAWQMLKGWNSHNSPPLLERELWSAFSNIVKRSFIKKIKF